MKAEIKNNELQISIPISLPPQKSKSGKTLILASTRGNQKVELEGCDFWIGLNVYTYPDMIKGFRFKTKPKELSAEEQRKIEEHNRKVSESKK